MTIHSRQGTRHVCCIIPPKMLRHFADQVTGGQRNALLDAAQLSDHMRGHRVGTGAAAFAATSTGEKRRTIYDARHSRRLPGVVAHSESGPASQDPVVNAAYDSSGATYDFYMETFQRSSVDGQGFRLDSTVHYSKHFNNAFWNGRQMVYGDGDGKLFTGFAQSLDVVAHELTHGVTQYTVPGGGLVYEGQSGALNESVSDVFGSLVKQWKRNDSAATADWLIGQGIMTPAAGHALRSMKDPGNKSITWAGDDQPGTMSGFEPEGDVHTNSGIPNHAFYLAAVKIGGNAWHQPGRIWYKALSLLSPNATFEEAAEATLHSATMIFGTGSNELKQVKAAWTEVGVI